MHESPNTGFPIIEEQEVTGESAEVYEEIKREMGFPAAPNIITAMGASPEALKMYWGTWYSMERYTSLPQTIRSMISYTIAETNNCTYCSASYELTCRTLGVDEDTLQNLISNLDNVNPLRVRAIITFALKVAKHPQDLTLVDYDNLRDLGVSNEEIMEIIMIAAIAVAGDIISDAFKVEVEDVVNEALGR